MAFIQRRIEVEFQLQVGSFDEGAFDTVRVKGLRVQANVSLTSGPVLGNAQIRIFGLTPSLLKKLSGLNQAAQAIRQNTVILYAGDDVNGLAVVFRGQITLALLDLASVPDSSLTVSALAGAFGKLKPFTPSTYPGSADAATIIGNLAAELGYDFENNGVSVILTTPYYAGTALVQVEKCAKAARIGWTIDKKTLAIWPHDGSRGGAIPLISADTGMVGYPTYTSGNFQGVAITTIFNPLLRIAGLVKIESGLAVANGIWGVFDIAHALESETPGGKWFSQFNAQAQGQNVQK